jgi:hypothetical protein
MWRILSERITDYIRACEAYVRKFLLRGYGFVIGFCAAECSGEVEPFVNLFDRRYCLNGHVDTRTDRR